LYQYFFEPFDSNLFLAVYRALGVDKYFSIIKEVKKGWD